MGIFDKFKQTLEEIFNFQDSGYIKRQNKYTLIDLEKCNGVAYNVGVTCENCIALNNCIFTSDNFSKFYHPNCKCFYFPIIMPNVITDLPIEKITQYLFVDEDKKKLIERLGYSIFDAEELMEIYCTEAKDSYLNGNYILKGLDKYGQRMGLETTIHGKGDYEDKSLTFYSGWKLFPNGKLINTTPFGGWID